MFKFAVVMLLGAVFFFLLGAFYSVSFDLSKWTDDCRFAVIVAYTCFLIPGFGLSTQ